MVPTEQISRRLAEALQLRSVTQTELSKRTGIDKGSISHYLKGDYTPTKERLTKIAVALQVSPVWLMGYDIPYQMPLMPVEDTIMIPVLGTVAAGSPLYADQNVIGHERVSPDLGQNLFGLQIHGDSMEPKISDGDVVIVRQEDTADSGQIVVALVNGNEAVCKKLMLYDDGSLALISYNPAFAPMVFTAKQVEDLPVKILGVVVEARSKF